MARPIEALRAIARRLEDATRSPEVDRAEMHIRPDYLRIWMMARAPNSEWVWEKREIPWRDFERMEDPAKTIGRAVDDCKLELKRAVKAESDAA